MDLPKETQVARGKELLSLLQQEPKMMMTPNPLKMMQELPEQPVRRQQLLPAATGRSILSSNGMLPSPPCELPPPPPLGFEAQVPMNPPYNNEPLGADWVTAQGHFATGSRTQMALGHVPHHGPSIQAQAPAAPEWGMRPNLAPAHFPREVPVTSSPGQWGPMPAAMNPAMSGAPGSWAPSTAFHAEAPPQMTHMPSAYVMSPDAGQYGMWPAATNPPVLEQQLSPQQLPHGQPGLYPAHPSLASPTRYSQSEMQNAYWNQMRPEAATYVPGGVAVGVPAC